MTGQVIFINLIAPILVVVFGYVAKKYFDKRELERERLEQARSEALMKPINEKLDSISGDITGLKNDMTELKNDIQQVDAAQTKNYLVTTLARIEHGEYLSETEMERLVEGYDHYIKKKEDGGLGGNSYVKAKYEKLNEEGKIM